MVDERPMRSDGRLGIEIRFTDDDMERLAARIVQLLSLQDRVSGDRWLDVPGASAHLGLTPNSIRGLVKRGQLPVYRTKNGRLRFSMTELDEWVRVGLARRTSEDLP